MLLITYYLLLITSPHRQLFQQTLLKCGTTFLDLILSKRSPVPPYVTFNIGGMPDMIEHQQNGYLALPFDIEDLARGITWVLEENERNCKLCDRAREKVEQEFSQQLQSQRYLSLFRELCSETNMVEISI